MSRKAKRGGRRAREGGSLREKVYETILEQIARHELGPGEPIVVSELAEKLKVSRTPVTEALRTLEAQGLVQGRANHVCRVAKFSLEDVDRLLEVRESLEVVAARAMALRGGQAEIDELLRIYSEIRAAAAGGDVPRATQNDYLFHRHLLTNCDNWCLARMANADTVLVMTKLCLSRVEHRLAVLGAGITWVADSHKPIAEAIEARDADAAEAAVRAHIRGIRKEIAAALD